MGSGLCGRAELTCVLAALCGVGVRMPPRKRAMFCVPAQNRVSKVVSERNYYFQLKSLA